MYTMVTSHSQKQLQPLFVMQLLLSASSIPEYLYAVHILHLECGLDDLTKHKFQLATRIRNQARKRFNSVSKETIYTSNSLNP